LSRGRIKIHGARFAEFRILAVAKFVLPRCWIKETMTMTQTMNQVQHWVAQLASDQMLIRQSSREQLVHDPSPAVTRELIGALRDPRMHVRWEAAKALQEIADPTSVSALVQALDDESKDVRWLAAEGLVALNRLGVLAVLEALTCGAARTMAIRTSAHHVLSMNKRYAENLAPVVMALEQLDPGLLTPVMAFTALVELGGY
jgi:HEAT repeat protein